MMKEFVKCKITFLWLNQEKGCKRRQDKLLDDKRKNENEYENWFVKLKRKKRENFE